MSQMPGGVRAVRAMLLAIGAGSLVSALWFVTAAATLETGTMGELIVGLLLLKATPFGLLAAIAIVTATKFSHGGQRARIGAVVVGTTIAASCTIGVLVHDGVWGFGVAAGFLVIVLSTSQDTRDWFGRWPR